MFLKNPLLKSSDGNLSNVNKNYSLLNNPLTFYTEFI